MSRLDDFTDRLNPLLVKELRQILTGRGFAAAFLIVLAIAWCTAVGAPLFRDTGNMGTAGRDLIHIHSLLLTGMLCIPVPLAAMHSFAFEHREQALEMLRVSPLSARQIVFGKLQVAGLHAGLYLAVLVPFMCLAYLLGGVGLLQILRVTLVVFAISTTLSMFALWMGLLSCTATRHVLATLALIVAIGIGFVICASLEEANELGTEACVLVSMLIGFSICRERVLVSTRPLPLRARAQFVDEVRMARLISTVRIATLQIRQHFPLRGQPLPDAGAVPFRVAHRQIMYQFLKAQALICPWTSRAGGTFLSYDSTAPLIAQVRDDLDGLILHYGWPHGARNPYECELQVSGWVRFPDTDPQALDRLDAAAAELERALAALPVAIIPHASSREATSHVPI